eukprot:8257707-Pyramimonas_sp.AAC.1
MRVVPRRNASEPQRRVCLRSREGLRNKTIALTVTIVVGVFGARPDPMKKGLWRQAAPRAQPLVRRTQRKLPTPGPLSSRDHTQREAVFTVQAMPTEPGELAPNAK